MLIKMLQKTIMDATGKMLDLTECDDIVTTLRSRGYKLTQREATDQMLGVVEEVENPSRAWELMWDESE